MARGFKTGGRKPGSKNKRTHELEAETQAAAELIAGVLGPATFSGDAHALLMAVYKDETKDIDLRLEAAKAAVRFEKPALANIESKSETLVRYVARVPDKKADATAWQEQHEPHPTTIQ
jgi:hypothetical protein